MKVTAIQMDMKFADPDYNFAHAEELVREAAKQKPDVITLPETWNVGFFPKDNLRALCDKDGERVKKTFSALAKELEVNIVAGSVANLKEDKVYNTSYIFNRKGECIESYDKTHLFTPMGEQDYFEFGGRTVTFELDGVHCGIIICYDIRFLELVRTLSLKGIRVLFVVAQWPSIRTKHWQYLGTTRAIENQMFVVCTNSCGKAGETQYGGHSAIYDPWGETLAAAEGTEKLITAELDLGVVENIRNSINVYRDRRPDLYEIK